MMMMMTLIRTLRAEAAFVSSPSHSLYNRRLMSTPSSWSWEMITNQSSKTVKLFKSIHRNKSKRVETGLTIAEGVRLVTDILSNEQSRRLVRRIIVSESLINGQSNNNEYQRQLTHWLDVVEMESRQSKEAFASGNLSADATEPVVINIGTEQVLSACSGTVTPQGVVALMEIPLSFDISTVSASSKESKIPPFFVVLDGLQDPGNVGTLLRSCSASHVSALVLLSDCCDVWNPKAIRSAMGATFRVPIIDLTERKDAMDQTLGILDRCGVESNRVFAATMERTGDGRSSIAHFDIGFGTSGAAIILGKEGEGLRKEVRNAISQGKISTVFVPMAEGTESLNAAICGSIIMFERMRQLSAIQSV